MRKRESCASLTTTPEGMIYPRFRLEGIQSEAESKASCQLTALRCVATPCLKFERRDATTRSSVFRDRGSRFSAFQPRFQPRFHPIFSTPFPSAHPQPTFLYFCAGRFSFRKGLFFSFILWFSFCCCVVFFLRISVRFYCVKYRPVSVVTWLLYCVVSRRILWISWIPKCFSTDNVIIFTARAQDVNA